MQWMVEVRTVLGRVLRQAMVVFYSHAEVSCCEIVVDFVNIGAVDCYLGVGAWIVCWASSDCEGSISVLRLFESRARQTLE